jgi:hypothetical protein
VFLIQLQPRRQDYALLSRTCEDVATLLFAAIEPIRVIEGAAAQPQDVWKPFQIEANGRPASAAEV